MNTDRVASDRVAPDRVAPDRVAPDRIKVVLVRPRLAANIGAAARAVANHGLGGLVLVDPAGFDPERARWMAPGAAQVVDEVRVVGTVAEAVEAATWVVGSSARPRRWDWPVLDPAGFADGVRATPGEVAVLFGPEDKGLSNDDLARCHALLCLPTTAHASLNLGAAVVAMASGLLGRLHAEGLAQAPGRAARDREPEAAAPVADQAAAVEAALGLLERSGYLAVRPRDRVAGTLYRLLGRAQPSARELHALRGMLSSLSSDS